jgi:hypothetical protein
MNFGSLSVACQNFLAKFGVEIIFVSEKRNMENVVTLDGG